MIRSARNTASSTLWVINTIVFLVFSQIPRSSCWSMFRVWASIDPNGSSIRKRPVQGRAHVQPRPVACIPESPDG